MMSGGEDLGETVSKVPSFSKDGDTTSPVITPLSRKSTDTTDSTAGSSEDSFLGTPESTSSTSGDTPQPLSSEHTPTASSTYISPLAKRRHLQHSEQVIIPSPTELLTAHNAPNSPESPDYNCDPYPDRFKRVRTFLETLNENPPPANDYILISLTKRKQKEEMLTFITELDIEELKSLSLYMHSIQVGNVKDKFFKSIRTECGAWGWVEKLGLGFLNWIQSYGNTTTWTTLRTAVQEQISKELVNTEKPGKQIPLEDNVYREFLQIFQQNPARFQFGQTKTEQNFRKNYRPADSDKTNAPPRSR